MTDLTFEIVSELLRLDAHSGRLYWRLRDRKWFNTDLSWRLWNGKFAGKEAFTSLNGHGYLHGSIFDRNYRAHRVVWLLHTGAWPNGEVDHENGKRNDNRPVNLRDVSSSKNKQNARRRSDNRSGVTGVFWDKKLNRWSAFIHADGHAKYLGSFAFKRQAIAARKAAEKEHDYHPNHGRAA